MEWKIYIIISSTFLQHFIVYQEVVSVHNCALCHYIVTGTFNIACIQWVIDQVSSQRQ